MCDKIIQMEPDYGHAWALKAQAQAQLYFGYNQGTDDGVSAADRAIQLDPSLAEAYSVKAHALAAKRQFYEAEQLINGALELAPESWEVNKEAAAIYLWQHKFAEAVPFYEKCVELVEDDRHSLLMLNSAYFSLGDEAGVKHSAERLLESCESGVERNPGDASLFGRGALALVVLGQINRAKEWMDRAMLIDPENLDIRYNFACVLINHSTDLQLAFEHLEYVFARSVGSVIRRADLDKDLDPVRNHPRFCEIYEAAMGRIARLDAEKAEQPSAPAAASSGGVAASS
jgi:adenylate cyclase